VSFAWLANPLFFLATVFYLFGRSRPAAWISLVSVLVALHTLWFDEVPSFGGNIMVTELNAGFYVWLSSLFLLLVASVVAGLRREQPKAIQRLRARSRMTGRRSPVE